MPDETEGRTPMEKCAGCPHAPQYHVRADVWLNGWKSPRVICNLCSCSGDPARLFASTSPSSPDPSGDAHDPLCSEGQYAGDQTMPCDCRASSDDAMDVLRELVRLDDVFDPPHSGNEWASAWEAAWERARRIIDPKGGE